MVTAATEQQLPKESHSLDEQWGDALGAGFVALPNVLLRHQAELRLDCEEMVVLANLLSHWRGDDRMPFPRSESLARRSGLSRRTVQRRLQQLENKGFIERFAVVREDDGRATTHYDLKKTVARLQPLGLIARVIRDEGLRKSAASRPGSPAQ